MKINGVERWQLEQEADNLGIRNGDEYLIFRKL